MRWRPQFGFVWGISVGLCLHIMASGVTASTCTDADLQGADLSGLDCSGFDLSARDLSPAPGPPPIPTRVEGTQFVGSNLAGANLEEVEGGCLGELCTNFTAASLRGTTWVSALLPHTLFDRAELEGALFTGADLTQASLVACNLNGVDLGAASLTQTNFSFAQSDCDWGGPEPGPDCPRFDGAVAPGVDFQRAQLDGAVFAGMTSGGDVEFYANFGSASVRGSDFSEAELPHANFDSASLVQADLSQADLSNGVFRLAYLDRATATCEEEPCVSVHLDDSNLEFASLVDVDFSLASLRGANLAHADLTRAALLEVQLTASDSQLASLSSADLSGVILVDADLAGAVLFAARGACVDSPSGAADTTPWCPDFSGANLSGADLSLARIEGLVATGTNLMDANLSQAFLNDLSHPCSEPGVEGEPPVCLHISPSSVSGPGTDMTGMVSRDSDWAGVNLMGATLVASDFSNSIFYAERTIEPEQGENFNQIYRADLTDADLTGAVLKQADLTGVSLLGARLDFADFTAATLDAVMMDQWTGVVGANFTESRLSGSDLRQVAFTGANFAEGATVEEADCALPEGGSTVDLVGAQLEGADFSAAHGFLSGCITVDKTTTYSDETQFPLLFNLRDQMTLVPEVEAFWLHGAAVGTLALIRALRRRKL